MTQHNDSPGPHDAEQLAARVAREATYWDNVVDENGRLQQRFNHVFLCPNAAWAERRHDDAIRASIAGKVVLDYGCGDGASSAKLLALGARHVYGLDLGEAAITKARARGLANATFVVGDAHRLPWPDQTFDVVVGRAILHHLDLATATRELVRALRPGGKLFFVEPLYHNPLAALPLSLGGAFVGLLIAQKSFSMPSLIGLIMLMGIATKNSILLVEYAIVARQQGMSRLEALMDACHKRARPIVMTTIAMGAGMLPIAIGLGAADASFRSPMSIAVIGGLITSTVLSLLVIPVVFMFMDDIEHFIRKTSRKLRGRLGHATGEKPVETP